MLPSEDLYLRPQGLGHMSFYKGPKGPWFTRAPGQWYLHLELDLPWGLKKEAVPSQFSLIPMCVELWTGMRSWYIGPSFLLAPLSLPFLCFLLCVFTIMRVFLVAQEPGKFPLEWPVLQGRQGGQGGVDVSIDHIFSLPRFPGSILAFDSSQTSTY